ncbi:MAG: hypothetical protein MJ131_02670 [Lachnospiraceae bacterium]|nr:hypothetical protein [Lachnospiraceae bacterium]
MIQTINKRNAIEIGVKGLVLAVTVIIAVILSALALYMANSSKSTINGGTTQYTQLMSDYSEITATMYDALDVSGDKVISVINEMCQTDYISVTVKTKADSSGTNYSNAANKTTVAASDGSSISPSGVQYSGSEQEADITNAKHINENASYRGKVRKNSNGLVINIEFTQH